MEVTVLGKSSATPDAGGANSGYLVREGGFTLLLDCGSGVFAKLRSVCEPIDVDAVLITHHHADHIIDLVPYSHALTFTYAHTGCRPLLVAPPDSAQVFLRIGDAFGVGSQILDGFRLDEYGDDTALQLGPLHVRFQPVPHYIPTWACELRSPDGKRFVFGADCAFNQELVSFAAGADLLLLEATEMTVSVQEPAAARGHMTPREAGQLGRGAQAKRLVLTHFSDLLDAAQIAAEGAEGFGGPVELAHEAMTLTI